MSKAKYAEGRSGLEEENTFIPLGHSGYWVKDATPYSRELGYTKPVFVTRAVWESCVHVPDGCSEQKEDGRIWTLLLAFADSCGDETGEVESSFVLSVSNDAEEQRTSELRAVSGRSGSRFPGVPVIIIMLASEYGKHMEQTLDELLGEIGGKVAPRRPAKRGYESVSGLASSYGFRYPVFFSPGAWNACGLHTYMNEVRDDRIADVVEAFAEACRGVKGKRRISFIVPETEFGAEARLLAVGDSGLPIILLVHESEMDREVFA